MMRSRRFWTPILGLIAMMAVPAVYGWGEIGHRVVGEVAIQLLDPNTKKVVQSFLRAEGSPNLGDIGRWADRIRSTRKDTAPWHYINIPLCGVRSMEESCPNGQCITGAISRAVSVLGDPSADRVARREAFKFLVHFVADIHQPMHAVDNGDKGGNLLMVRYHTDSRQRRDNLHNLWDNSLLQERLRKEPKYARRLLDEITAVDFRSWASGTPEDWAQESHSLAVTHAYGKLPGGFSCSGIPRTMVDIDASYTQQSEAVLDLQLKRAAVRLAYLLDQHVR